MRRFATRALAVGVAFGGMLVALASKTVPAAEDDQAVLQADHALVQALGKADKTAVGELLDANFTWTDSDGKTQDKAQVLQALPALAIGDQSGLDVKERTYGQVGAVTASRGKTYVLRVWVKRPAGWRALVYHQVRLSEQPPTAGGSGVNDCENPCKTVPYKP